MLLLAEYEFSQFSLKLNCNLKVKVRSSFWKEKTLNMDDATPFRFCKCIGGSPD